MADHAAIALSTKVSGGSSGLVRMRTMCWTAADRLSVSSGTGTESWAPSGVMILARIGTSASLDLTGFRPLQSLHFLALPFLHSSLEYAFCGSFFLHLPEHFFSSDAAAAGAGAGASPSPSLSLLLEGSTARYFDPVPFFGLVCFGRLVALL